ncbi:MAG: beta-glucosidase [Acidimicrobiia bacterium]|nr:beta-glucosidase [Acidimicrobiia bacterium]NNF10408.1 beta-glucosidase [Acidimicrobiia bacterium]NNL68597.1 beta-glucosidase [Acidimicrobiia bacterium]
MHTEPVDLSLLPSDFAWGVATSAYQIEGSPRADGAGESIWDRFAVQPGTILNGDSGETACDHYRRWEEDVELMAELGVGAYRFSVAWTRILPDGAGEVNRAGLTFYERLVDALRDAGIEPYVTLYHWDLPQRLEEAGGWRNRETAGAFVEYARVVSEVLGDRVTRWMTHNEPWVTAFAGHRDGVFAPGRTDFGEALAVGHHVLLSHGLAVPVIRQNVPGASVGIALDCRPAVPATRDPADVAAQRHFDGFRNRWFFDPVFGKGYPSDMMKAYRARGYLPAKSAPWLQSGDLELIAEPIDFVGINYYTSIAVRAGEEESEDTGVPHGSPAPEGYTEMGWPITPGELTRFLERVHETYEPPMILITENGASYSDGPDEAGVIADDRRIRYLERHIGAVAQAAATGVPVAGYFVWSLLDNLEWASGFSQRFGLVWVDHATQQRVPKNSFHWYRQLIGG